jgi:cytosine deaminase
MRATIPHTLPELHVWLNAHVPPGLVEPGMSGAWGASAAAPARMALVVQDGRIAAVHAGPGRPAGLDAGIASFDLDGATVVSAFVDPHVHLDKGDLLAAGLAPERDLFEAVKRVRGDYVNWSEGELHARMDFALRTAWVHGTRALNSYCDWSAPEGPLAARVLQALRERWAGRIELAITSLAALHEFADPARAETIARSTAAAGAALGPFIYPGAPVELLERVFDLAERFDLRLDFHVDEHLDPPVANVAHVARLARERGWGARTVCGHCCVLGVLEPGQRDARLDELAAAGVGLVSLPSTNLYLQDNGADPADPARRRSPRRRGLLPVHEARSRGIRVAFGSDNHRDPFFPAGDLDPLQALALAAMAAHLDDPVGAWIDTVCTTPARLLGLTWDGVLRAGAPADFVIHPGRCSAEVISRAAHGRIVVRGGQRVREALPDFRELDGVRAPPGSVG